MYYLPACAFTACAIGTRVTSHIKLLWEGIGNVPLLDDGILRLGE